MTEKKSDPDFFALDDRIPELAREGKLAGAGREAIRLQHEKGLPVTIVEGENIIRWYPDGHKVIVQPVE